MKTWNWDALLLFLCLLPADARAGLWPQHVCVACYYMHVTIILTVVNISAQSHVLTHSQQLNTQCVWDRMLKSTVYHQPCKHHRTTCTLSRGHGTVSQQLRAKSVTQLDFHRSRLCRYVSHGCSIIFGSGEFWGLCWHFKLLIMFPCWFLSSFSGVVLSSRVFCVGRWFVCSISKVATACTAHGWCSRVCVWDWGGVQNKPIKSWCQSR